MPPPLPVTFAVLALVTGNAMREVPPLRVTPEVLVILKSPGGVMRPDPPLNRRQIFLFSKRIAACADISAVKALDGGPSSEVDKHSSCLGGPLATSCSAPGS